MRTLLTRCFLCVLLAGCANVREERPPVAVEDILSQAPAAADYAEPQRCLRVVDYQDVDVLDNQHLLFFGRRNRVWINRLRAPCVGLSPRSTLRFDLHANSLCNLDTVSAIDTYFWVWRRSSAICSLGEFEPITVEQADLLKAAFER